MIEQELLLLGLLKEGAKHGYEIKKKIDEIVSIFAGVNARSIYYPLAVLEKSGLLKKTAAKTSRRPERFVYQLTAKGIHRFEELLSASFLQVKRPQFSLDLSLYFLPYIDAAIARRQLRGRILILSRIARSLREMARERSGALSLILEHNLKMLEAEKEFLSQYIQTLAG